MDLTIYKWRKKFKENQHKITEVPDLEAEYEVPDSNEDVLEVPAGAWQDQGQQVADTQEWAHADQGLQHTYVNLETMPRSSP